MSWLPEITRIVGVLFHEKRAPRSKGSIRECLHGADEVFVIMIQRLTQRPGRALIDHLIDSNPEQAHLVQLYSSLNLLIGRHAGAVDRRESAGHSQLSSFHEVATSLEIGQRGQGGDEALELARSPFHEFPGGFSIFVLLDMTTLWIGGVASNAGKFQGFAICRAPMCVSADEHRIVRSYGINQFLPEFRRIPDIRHPTTQYQPPRLGPRPHAFPRCQGVPDHFLHSLHGSPLTNPGPDIRDLWIEFSLSVPDVHMGIV